MARYIDADNLINELSAACMPIYEKSITGILGDNSSIADIINEQPTADVQEVVRCKDCIYRKSSEFCECREPDFYCADGARMDGKDGEED